MILHPSVQALTVGSILTSLLLLYAASYGVAILHRWDLASGSETQLVLERKTYLISTMVSCAFGFELLSFFLLIYTADDLCRLFAGAMCAAGTLNVNAFGYPALIYKMVNFILAGTWLILNRVDNKACDYPLIRSKYIMLLLMTPVMITETVLQFLYFQRLRPDIITSCCGSLFSAETSYGGLNIAVIQGWWMQVSFYSCMGALLLLALYVYRTDGRGAYLYSLLSSAVFAVSLTALIFFFSPYFYELPTHHCPFCLLQREYGYVGYMLYSALFGGAVTGIGIGGIGIFKKVASLNEIVPAFQRKLVLASLISYGLFTIIVTWKMLFSNLRM